MTETKDVRGNVKFSSNFYETRCTHERTQMTCSHLGLFQLVKRPLQTLQHVDDDFDVVLVLLEHALDFGQDLPTDCHVVHVLAQVHHCDQRSVLGDDGQNRHNLTFNWTFNCTIKA